MSVFEYFAWGVVAALVVSVAAWVGLCLIGRRADDAEDALAQAILRKRGDGDER